jgi:hypothetical protein
MKRLSSLTFIDPRRVGNNVDAVRRYSSVLSSVPGYRVLGELQKTPTSLFNNTGRHRQVLQRHVPRLKPLLTEIMGGEFPRSFRALSDDLFSQYSTLAMAGERLWASRYPDDFRCYEQLIGNVIYAYGDNFSGGTVSTAIGWIWLSPVDHWTPQDYSENLIHEYAHNALYLEEMVHTLFSVSADVISLEENHVISSIRGVKRPFNQSFHAAAVAMVLAEYSLESGWKDKADQYLSGLLPSLDDLKEKRALMSSHGFGLLKEMIENALKLFDNVKASRKAKPDKIAASPRSDSMAA